MTVIVMAGKPGVGKTTLARMLTDMAAGSQILDVGHVLLECIGAKVPRDLAGRIFIEKFGVMDIPDRILDRVRTMKGPVIVDAVRHATTWSVISSEVGNAHLVGVICPEELRLIRLTRRLSAQAVPEPQDALIRYEQLSEGAGALALEAPIRIDNSYGLKALRRSALPLADLLVE